MTLFERQSANLAPLADRMRPETLDEFIGQSHILAEGSLLRRAVAADKLGSCIFFGPPGVGKTSLASIIAQNTRGAFVKMNAVSSGVADAKKVIEEAKNRLDLYGKKTYLLLDECHRWSKAQSDCVLSAIEQGSIIFIGSMTESPYVSMTGAIVSRCRIFEFKRLSPAEVKAALLRSTESSKGLKNLNVKITIEAADYLSFACAGDLRTAYNALELAAVTTSPDKNGQIIITKQTAEQSLGVKPLSVDESTYYDMLSAFCKCLRGSDPDAALFWAFRLIEAGCDPLLIFRRLIAHSAEDVGLAEPRALQIAVAALTAYEKMGLPEGRLPLTEAIIFVTASPKSNSVVNALYSAADAARAYPEARVPLHLRDTNYPMLEKPLTPYIYPHDYGGYIEQQYLPDELKNAKFYHPGANGAEPSVKEFLDKAHPKKK